MKRPSYRRFALFTTALTGILVALGVYTAATGSGLACSQQWPLCDGGVLPQTVPSFIEWFHRLVAMITGFAIVGVVAAAWRGEQDRKTALFATAALVLLPFQISVGAITVTLNGAIPWGYSVPTHAAHLLFALSIFTALTLSTISAMNGHYRRSAHERSRLAVGAALVLIVANFLVSRVSPVIDYGPAAQGAFALTALAAFAALVAAAVWLPGTGLARYRPGVFVAGAAVFLVTLLGRDLVVYTDEARLVNGLLYLVGFAAAAVVAYAARGGSNEGRPSLA
ncbi:MULTISPECIES: COX15/CtaA family protein [Halolamina]|uniref:Cytochrome c oxidase assembly protein subunit 15 n=1 Tax=Halolamina pelagica TaxID=699431 RepID=A0A1I5QP88_9EURY|nr:MULTISPECIES: COX15/CtaA family protein [Halolamina]NHX35478.1 cytochrome oxidase assembly protein [Halolamina sp. R1-12]SFP48075.1 cytochrome c oxidase assembly protein subunit 15 [Halolamina pelagica]